MRHFIRFLIPYIPVLGIVLLFLGLSPRLSTFLHRLLVYDFDGQYDYVISLNRHFYVHITSCFFQALSIFLIIVLWIN